MSEPKKRVVVTGGAGKLGRAVVHDLLDNGYDVLLIDRVVPAERLCPSIVVDLSDFGQTIDAIGTVGESLTAGPIDPPYAVVHLAAIPAPRLKPNAETFRNNTLGDYNVFEACRKLGVKRVVYASSETVLGLPFDVPPPYVPIDEAAPPCPNSAYSLSKLLAETMAEQFCRWDSSLTMTGLRFSNVMDLDDYDKFESFQKDARPRKWNLWGYIDARDAAQAVRKSIEATHTGSHVYVIANADTVMRRPNKELLAEVFPNVAKRGEIDANATLLSIDKARAEIGYEPEYSWRQTTVKR